MIDELRHEKYRGKATPSIAHAAEYFLDDPYDQRLHLVNGHSAPSAANEESHQKLLDWHTQLHAKYDGSYFRSTKGRPVS